MYLYITACADLTYHNFRKSKHHYVRGVIFNWGRKLSEHQIQVMSICLLYAKPTLNEKAIVKLHIPKH